MFIGKTSIPLPLALAPMAGLTSQPFRQIAKEHGCGLLVSEMISSKGLLHNNQKTFDLLRFTDKERPFAVQLFGNQPGEMARAAKAAEKFAPDFIDVNMGCPMAKIVGNGEGAALLKNPGLSYEIVARMADSVKIPVTVKIRAGWDENSINAQEMALLMEKAGAMAITLHARTRSQFYGGAADWRIIKQVADSVKVPVIGNGDIVSAAGALTMMSSTGCAAVMVGRAAAGNPWLLLAVAAALTGKAPPAPPDFKERMAMLERHLELLIEHEGEQSAVRQMRAIAGHYVRGLPGAARLRRLLNQADSRADYQGICRANG